MSLLLGSVYAIPVCEQATEIVVLMQNGIFLWKQEMEYARSFITFFGRTDHPDLESDGCHLGTLEHFSKTRQRDKLAAAIIENTFTSIT